MGLLVRDPRVTLQNAFAWQKTTPTGPHDPKAKKSSMAHQLSGAVVGKILRAAEHQPQHLADCLHVVYDPQCQHAHIVRLAIIVWDRFVSRTTVSARKQARMIFALPAAIESIAAMLRGGDHRASESDLSRLMGYDSVRHSHYDEQYRELFEMIRRIMCEIEESAIKPVSIIVHEMWQDPELEAS